MAAVKLGYSRVNFYKNRNEDDVHGKFRSASRTIFTGN